MSSYNKVIFCGFLTRDPEARYGTNGKAICDFCVAANHTWKNASGEKSEKPTFVDFTAFGTVAETISRYFKKGHQILVEGRLDNQTWEDKQTHQKRSKLRVIVDSFRFMTRKENDETPDQSQDDYVPH